MPLMIQWKQKFVDAVLYCRGMKGSPITWLLGTVLLTFVQGAVAEVDVWVLNAEEWARPRDGVTVVQMEPLPDVVKAWSSQAGQRLMIRYPGGEEGLLWAHELRSWLVALGIPMDDQELVAGSNQGDRVELELMR